MKKIWDHYSELAKKEGYPARSVYKLEEILNKTRLVKRNSGILDIGAAPGSWSLYLYRKFQARITAIDLQPLTIQPNPKIEFIQGDAFSPEIINMIKEKPLYDGIVSDAAPSTSGNKTIDGAASCELANGVIKLCRDVLKPGGFLIVKIFQCGDEKEQLDEIRANFQTARALKPKASRNESFEVFFIGTGYRGTKS